MLISDKGSNYPVSMEQLLREAVALNGSDLHLVAIRRPTVRVSGKMRELDYPQAQPIDLEKLVLEVINDRQKKQLEENLELDFSYSIPKCARFRGNIAFQRGTLAVVFRVVPFEVPELSNLALPRDVERLCTLTRGLILVTGPTGSGKSTTMAAMLGRINQTRSENIITIEDPIEFLHSHNMSTVIQREVGVDTLNFGSALRMALRHDPDVIMIGEMRDLDSISIALTAAETGHLVISTLHTQNAPLSISRIVDSFPGDAKGQVRQQLSNSLRAIISQQLVPTVDGKRAIAIEYMVDTPAIRSMIRESREHQLYSSIQTGKQIGMQTMDQSLSALFRAGRISYEVMLQYAIDTKEVIRLTNEGF